MIKLIKHHISSPRSLKSLNDHINKLEKEYDTLQEEVAKGETSNFGKESVAQFYMGRSRYENLIVSRSMFHGAQ